MIGTNCEKDEASGAVGGQGPWFEKPFSLAIQIFLWGYVAIAVLCSLAAPLGKFDDAIPLVDGMLVQQGHTPNLDFYSFYPPLSLYVNAAAFTLLGKTVLGPRLIGALLFLMLLVLVARFYRYRFPCSGPFVPAALWLFAASIGAALSLPPWPGLAVSLIALFVYLHSRRLAGRYALAVTVSGLLTGIALVYRVNFGGYVALVIAIDITLGWWLDEGARWNRFRIKTELATITAFAVTLAVVAVGFCFWAYATSIGIAVSQFVINSQRLMANSRFIDLRYGADVACAVALPPAWFFFRLVQATNVITARALVSGSLAIALLALALAGRSHSSIALIVMALEIALVIIFHVFVYRLERSELCLLLFFCCLLHYFLSRADFAHWRILPIGAAMLLPFLLTAGSNRTQPYLKSSGSSGTAVAVLLVAAFVCSAALTLRPEPALARNGIHMLADLVRRHHLDDTNLVLDENPPERAWLSVYSDPNELQALRYLRARTNAGDPIFVGVPDHSRVFFNNLRIYWLAGRPIGVRMFQLETRVATELPVQRDIISDLERNRVKWVVIDNELILVDETFRKRAYAGSKFLDQYIASHYREQARFGEYAVLTRIAR